MMEALLIHLFDSSSFFIVFWFTDFMGASFTLVSDYSSDSSPSYIAIELFIWKLDYLVNLLLFEGFSESMEFTIYWFIDLLIMDLIAFNFFWLPYI